MISKDYLLIFALTFFGTSLCSSQDLRKHEWKNRVLLISSKLEKPLNEQLTILLKDSEGLKERKLIIYKVLPNKYAEGIQSDLWLKNEKFYAKIKGKRSDFEVILIGLDGGVKLRQMESLTTEKLFTLIDGMPMRRREIKN